VITDGGLTRGSWSAYTPESRDNAALICDHGVVHAARPVVTG